MFLSGPSLKPPSFPVIFVLQDKLNVVAFADPKVQGVTVYLSDFSRPVADKLLNGDIFSGAVRIQGLTIMSSSMGRGLSVQDGY